MIDASLSLEQTTPRSTAHKFASTHLTTARATYSAVASNESKFRSTLPLYREAVAAGLIQSQIPTPLGGTGGTLLDLALMVEEMYSVDTSASLIIFGTGLGLSPLLLSPDEELKERFLKPFLMNEDQPIESLVHSEPGGTDNWLEVGGGLKTTARKDGDDWILSGDKHMTKLWATNCGGWDGRGADLECVSCRFEDPSDPSISSKHPSETAMILIVTREVVASNELSAYQVLSRPETRGKNLLAALGKGAALIEQAFTASAAIVGAMSVGVMRRCFDATLKYAKTNGRNGAMPIIDRQSAADLLITCSALMQNPDAAELAYEAKIFCSDNAVQSVVEATAVMGLTAYGEGQPFGELLNDAICLPIFDGGNVGIRRRQIEKLFKDPEYQPWAASFGRGSVMRN